MAVVANEGSLFVVSSPSGAGKNTVLAALRAKLPALAVSVSATTRPPRSGEADGRDYYFMDRAEFERRRAAGEFVEWAEVHGNLYGTLRAELARLRADGRDALLEIDVQGMAKLRAQGLEFVSVFIMPPSFDELERRLRARGTDRPEVVALRLENAWKEMSARKTYDYIVVNDRVEDAVADMEAIVRARRCRSNRFA